MSQARDLGDAANFLDNVTSDIQSQINAIAGTPVGTIITFGGTSAPTGYLPCEGGIYLKSMYPDLWAAIGETWGTATTTQFYVPDLRGAFLRGTGSHGTHNMANGNDFAGQAVGSFENDQIQNMKSFTDGSANGNAMNASAADYGTYNLPWYGASGGNWSADGFIENGQGTPRVGDETRPFNAGILYCIKT